MRPTPVLVSTAMALALVTSFCAPQQARDRSAAAVRKQPAVYRAAASASVPPGKALAATIDAVARSG